MVVVVVVMSVVWCVVVMVVDITPGLVLGGCGGNGDGSRSVVVGDAR